MLMCSLMIAALVLGAQVGSDGVQPQRGRLKITDSVIELRWFFWNKVCYSLYTGTEECVLVDCGQLQWSLQVSSTETECKCCRMLNGYQYIHQTNKGCVKDLVIGLLSYPLSIITSIPASTARECQSKCTQQDNCTFFSFHWPGQTHHTKNCFLKKADTWTDVDLDEGKISGFPLTYCPGREEEVMSAAPNTKALSTSHPPTSQPPFNYTVGDLVFVPEPMSWVEALHHCAKNGSRLVHILDSCTQTRVEELLAAVVPYWGCMEKVWVGLERCMINPQAPWEWSGGAAVGDYKHWITSFPRNPCCFHCGQLVQEGRGGEYLWQDACCQNKLPFICQQTSTSRPTNCN